MCRSIVNKIRVNDKGIRRRIAMVKPAMGGLSTKLIDRGIKLGTKVQLVNGLVFPIVGAYCTERIPGL